MTALLSDISAWEGWTVPGGFNPLYRRGNVVNPERHKIRDEIQPQTDIAVQPRPIGDERGGILKELHKLIKGEESQAKITDALPRYRLQQ